MFGGRLRASIEGIISVISAAQTRIRENPSILKKRESAPSGESATSQAPLQLPEKVTLDWLFKNVPYSLWFWLIAAFITVFGVGVSVAFKLPFIQQWYGVMCKLLPSVH